MRLFRTRTLAPSPEPLRGAERNSPAPATRGFSFEGGSRWTAAAHARGPPCLTLAGQAQAPRARPGSLLSSEDQRGYPLVHMKKV